MDQYHWYEERVAIMAITVFGGTLLWWLIDQPGRAAIRFIRRITKKEGGDEKS